MEQDRFAPGASAGRPADEPAAPFATPAFATQAEEDAFWAGVTHGIHAAGGAGPILPGTGRWLGAAETEGAHSERHLALQAPSTGGAEALPVAGEELATDILAFTPAYPRPRTDGWTPQRQREFVEALADTGLVNAACERVGMSEQSLGRLRRRADARAFDAACTAAQRRGARRIQSIAYQRAIEGTIKRRYYRGELIDEERVHDNRLLIALINKMPGLFEPDPAADAVEADWEPWLDAIEQGLPCPPPPPAAPEPDPEPIAGQVWEDEGELLTNCPPPSDFASHDLYEEDEEPGHRSYQRQLTPAEHDWWEAEGQDAADEQPDWIGSTFHLGRPTFFPWGSEPSETSAESAGPEDGESEASPPSGESRTGAAGGSSTPADEPDRRRG